MPKKLICFVCLYMYKKKVEESKFLSVSVVYMLHYSSVILNIGLKTLDKRTVDVIQNPLKAFQ